MGDPPASSSSNAAGGGRPGREAPPSPSPPAAPAAAAPPSQGLLRLFTSQWFNPWLCVQYLWLHPGSGVEDYLCNKLNELPEPEIERYLLQFVYIAAGRPGSALERTIVGLCSKSFVIAIKARGVGWGGRCGACARGPGRLAWVASARHRPRRA